MEAFAWKLLETSFFSFLTTSTIRKTNKGAGLRFFPKKGDNDAYGSTVSSAAKALCKNHKGAGLFRYGKR